MARKLSAKSLSIFLMITYLISYLTRINFGAIIIEMVSETGFSKSQLSIAITGSFVTYGLGQIISGFFGDRFQPKNLVFTGLLTTVLINLLIPFCPSPYLMAFFWCINGFAQALMWPPIVRILASLLSEEEYNRASVIVSYGSAGGTILVYFAAPLIIKLTSWHCVFFFSAVCGAVMAAVWYMLCPQVPNAAPQKAKGSVSALKYLFSPMMLIIMLSIILQGSLRDGITTWMPSFISETFNLGNEIAILTGVLLPVFTVVCIRISKMAYDRTAHNPPLCAGILFGCGALFAGLLLLFCQSNATISVLLLALLAGCMHGVNFILICLIPKFFGFTGNVSLISGVINSCTYVGSAISTYGIAVLTENFGWRPTIGVWFGIAAAGTLLCLIVCKPWSKFVKTTENS